MKTKRKKSMCVIDIKINAFQKRSLVNKYEYVRT